MRRSTRIRKAVPPKKVVEPVSEVGDGDTEESSDDSMSSVSDNNSDEGVRVEIPVIGPGRLTQEMQASSGRDLLGMFIAI